MTNFITHIQVHSSRNVKDFSIPLSNEKRQHLIITGKNGSGKTSLLEEIKKFLIQIQDDLMSHVASTKLKELKKQEKLLSQKPNDKVIKSRIKDIKGMLLLYWGGTEITFSTSIKDIHKMIENGQFILAYFDSKRFSNLHVPTGINKIQLKTNYQLEDTANVDFIQYLVNLKADRSFAKDDNELDTVEQIDEWFNNFEKCLQDIFGFAELQLKFDRKTYNFQIITNELEPFSFNNLSDGYSAIISIVSELILRMEAHEVKSYDLEGVVLIDEIETHLHVELQKKILPFLTNFFPKIQFIVTTHSPFVLSSIANATICDLETQIVTNDLSNYSYDALIESYFKTDKYSETLKQKIAEFEQLILQNDLTVEQQRQLNHLRDYFDHSPKYLAPELHVKLQELKLKELTTGKKGQ